MENDPSTKIEEFKKEYLDFKNKKLVDSQLWLDFTSKLTNLVDQLVKEAIKSKDPKVNKLAIDACNLALLSSQQIGYLHPLVAQLALQSGLLNYQSRQFFRAGQFFFIAYKSFKALKEKDHSQKSLKYCIESYFSAAKEYFAVATRLMADYYHDLAWNYLIRASRSLLRLEWIIAHFPPESQEKSSLTKRCQNLLQFVEQERSKYDSSAVEALIEILNRLLVIITSEEIKSEIIEHLEAELLLVLPSEPRLLLTIYKDGRHVYGFDFEHKTDDSPMFIVISGILFATVTLLQSELKVGSLSQIQTEEGVALIEIRDPLIFVLLCRGEPGILRGRLKKFVEEFNKEYSAKLTDWLGEATFPRARSMIDLIFD
ncbi:MAG: hypothetical protein ACFFD4_34785 [Candidatus Odinarchaeota archaeon]